MGALTSKIYAFQARPWELRKERSYNIFDSFCTEVIVEIRGLEIRRILPLPTSGWLSDNIRKLIDSFDERRLLHPKLLNWEYNQNFEADWEIFNEKVNDYMTFLKKSHIVINFFIKKKVKRNEFNQTCLKKSLIKLTEYEKVKRRTYKYYSSNLLNELDQYI